MLKDGRTGWVCLNRMGGSERFWLRRDGREGVQFISMRRTGERGWFRLRRMGVVKLKEGVRWFRLRWIRGGVISFREDEGGSRFDIDH